MELETEGLGRLRISVARRIEAHLGARDAARAHRKGLELDAAAQREIREGFVNVTSPQHRLPFGLAVRDRRQPRRRPLSPLGRGLG